MGFLATVKDFCKFLMEEDGETPIYTTSEGLEKEVYGCIARYGFWHDGDIDPTDDIIKDLWYDTTLLDHVALQNDISRKFDVDLPSDVRIVGEIYNYVKAELEKRGQPATTSEH